MIEFEGRKLSLTTDFNGSKNDPEEPITQMAEAGFEFAHWCHEWNTTKRYSPQEMKRFADVFRQTGVQLIDLHASEGSEKLGAYWLSEDESIRSEGVKLIANRLEMTQYLGGKAAVLHVPGIGDTRLKWSQFNRSMKELLPVIEGTGVRIAFENLYQEGEFTDNMGALEKITSEYSENHVGVCLDSGHLNLSEHTYSQDGAIWRLRGRIIALHLHDNPGRDPQNPEITPDNHMLPFTGSVDWDGLTELLAHSTYTGPLTSEASLKIHFNEGMTINEFLQESQARGMVLAGMLEEKTK